VEQLAPSEAPRKGSRATRLRTRCIFLPAPLRWERLALYRVGPPARLRLGRNEREQTYCPSRDDVLGDLDDSPRRSEVVPHLVPPTALIARILRCKPTASTSCQRSRSARAIARDRKPSSSSLNVQQRPDPRATRYGHPHYRAR
jgi:hypothetical protein